MIGLLVAGVVGFTVLLVIGILGAVLAMLFGLLILPFKLLGFALKGLGFLIALPFLALAGVIAAIVFGAGVLILFAPAIPLLLLAAGIWWLVRRGRRPQTA